MLLTIKQNTLEDAHHKTRNSQSKGQMDTNLEIALILLKLNEILMAGKELNKYVAVYIVWNGVCVIWYNTFPLRLSLYLFCLFTVKHISVWSDMVLCSCCVFLYNNSAWKRIAFGEKILICQYMYKIYMKNECHLLFSSIFCLLRQCLTTVFCCCAAVTFLLKL